MGRGLRGGWGDGNLHTKIKVYACVDSKEINSPSIGDVEQTEGCFHVRVRVGLVQFHGRFEIKGFNVMKLEL